MRENKTALTYETYRTQTHGYDHTHVVVRLMYVEDTAERLEGTVDNKDGYGSPEAAARMGETLQAMLDAGHKVHFEPTIRGLHVHVRWQHYYGGGELDYCEPAYEDLGRSLGQIDEGMKFLKKIGRRIEKARATRRDREAVYKSGPRPVSNHTFSRPEDFLAALARMKESFEVRRDPAYHAWVLTDAKKLPAAAEAA